MFTFRLQLSKIFYCFRKLTTEAQKILQLDLHILPRIGSKAIEDVTVADLQGIFNAVDGSKATKDKIKQVLHSIYEHAVEDGIVPKNLTKSKNLKITGTASKTTPPYTVEQMKYLASNLNKITSDSDRTYLILQMFHPLRLEEVLGLKWADIDHDHGLLHIQRAVTHPTRNQPEIKDTKTVASARILGLSSLVPHRPASATLNDFVIGGKVPYSYTQVRRMCKRIQRETGFADKITPIHFRTTALTDLYEQTKDITQVQAAAGHTTATMTLKYYVKGRTPLSSAAAIIEQTYLPQ